MVITVPSLTWCFQRVPYPDFKSKTITKLQSVDDIEKCVKECSRASLPYCAGYAYGFKGKDTVETCYKVWSFLRRYFTYEEEEEELQSARTVNRILYDPTGDCKHYSTFAYCTLKALGVDTNFRLCQYKNRDAPTHIYVVARDPKGREIIIDGTLSQFNEETDSEYIFDV